MHRFRAPSIAPGTFFAAQFSAGYTTSMSRFDLRQAQGLMVVAQGGSIREVAELICASVIGVFACARRFA